MGASKSSGDGSDVADSVIRLFDVTTGRERGRPVRHSVKIMSLALSQYAGQPLRPVDDTSGSGSSGSGAGVADRLIAFVDRDHDLWIASSSNEAKREKIASMVDSMAWHDASESLLALADGKLVRWVYPHAALCGWDTDTISESTPVPDVGKMPSLMHFFGAKASVRRCVLCLSFSRAHHRPTLRRRSPSSPPAHPSLSLSLSLSLFFSPQARRRHHHASSAAVRAAAVRAGVEPPVGARAALVSLRALRLAVVRTRCNGDAVASPRDRGEGFRCDGRRGEASLHSPHQSNPIASGAGC
jgi:hypothetical protein